jgi:hypothetical protein
VAAAVADGHWYVDAVEEVADAAFDVVADDQDAGEVGCCGSSRSSQDS